MKTFITLVAITLVHQNINAVSVPPAVCPTTYPEQLYCTNGTKAGQIVDSNGCFIWMCVPNQPYCCPQTSPETIKCTSESEPGQIVDPTTNCKIWTCVPKQPYCCGDTRSAIKCSENFYSAEAYDLTTGCLIWTCARCPDIDLSGACCFIGTPIIVMGSNGCPTMGCSTSEEDTLIFAPL